MHDKPKFDPQGHHRRSIRLKGYDYSQQGAYFVTFCVKDKQCLFGKIANAEMHLNEAGYMIDKWWQKIPEKFPDIELGEYQIMPNHFHAIVINVGADPRLRPETQKLIVNPTTTENTSNLGADPRVRPETHDQNVNTFNVGADPRVRPETHDQNVNTFNVGADPPVRPETHNNMHLDIHAVEQFLFAPNMRNGKQIDSPVKNIIQPNMHEGEHVGSPLHKIVQWFKTMSTNEYIRGVKQNGWNSFNGKLWQRNYFEHIIRNEKSLYRITEYIYDNPVNWESDHFFVE